MSIRISISALGSYVLSEIEVAASFMTRPSSLVGMLEVAIARGLAAVIALVTTSALTAATLGLLLRLRCLIDVEITKLEPDGFDVPVVLLSVHLLELADKCRTRTGHDLGTGNKTALDGHHGMSGKVRVADNELCVGQRVSHPLVVESTNAGAFKNTL